MVTSDTGSASMDVRSISEACYMCIEKIKEILDNTGIKEYGFAPFEKIKDSLISCSGIKRLPQNPKTVITAVFPYYRGETSGEISAYAVGADYHPVVGGILRQCAEKLKKELNGYAFEPFCDSSPIPEVKTALLAGLGLLGKNGLLITPGYGSFVFIGEIVTDLDLNVKGADVNFCPGCGACLSACPSGVLKGSFCRENCVSFISQKKGVLSEDEEVLLRRAGTVWGCDICQNVCPLNRKAATTDIRSFRENIKTCITAAETLEPDFEKEFSNRAFMWKGSGVLKRNIGILHGGIEDNNSTGHKPGNRE